MPTSEHGFGSPSEWLDTPPGYVPEQYDTGFGSPTTLDEWGDLDLATAYGDTGFGAPLTILLIVADPADVRDDGGQVIRAVADWPIVGPYRVELVDAAGTSYGCYGCRAGEGDAGPDCYTDTGRQWLTFASPRLPVGTYALRVTWVDGTQQTTTVEGAVTVHYRARYGMVYELRSRFPARAYQLRWRVPQTERVLGA